MLLEALMSSPPFKIKSRFIQAGAGSGKTTRLVSEVVKHFIQAQASGLPFPRLVLSTFTVKAAHEIKERLLEKAFEIDNDELAQYVESNDIKIGTLHSLFFGFLRKISSELGFQSEVQLIAEDQDFKRKRKLILELFKNDEFSPLLRQFSLSEITSICLGLYGSQNTERRAITHEVANQAICSKIQTFLRLINLNEENFPKDHLYVEYLINTYDFLIEISDPSDSKMTSDEIQQTAIAIFSETPAKPRKSKNQTFDFSEIHQSFLEIKEIFKEHTGFISSEFKEYESTQNLIFSFYKEYELKLTELILSSGLLGLQDVEAFLWKQLIGQKKQVSYSDTRDYWMIDEFQDTSPMQIDLIHYFKQNASFFYVGDPQQSIYLFRGARSRVFEDLKKQLRESNQVNFENLDFNYRTHEELLCFVNSFLESCPAQFKTLTPGQKEYECLQEDSPFQVYLYNTKDDELSRFQALKRRVNELKKIEAQNCEIGVLCRTHKQTQQVFEELSSLGIAAEITKTKTLIDHQVVRDLASFLRFLIQPHWDENLIQLLRSPHFFLDDRKIVSLIRDQKKEISLFSSLQDEYTKLYLKLSFYLKLNEQQNPLTVLELLLRESRFFQSSTSEMEQNIALQFLGVLKEKSTQPQFLMSHFLDELENSKSNPVFKSSSLSQENTVKIMTIHGAKGLEFNHVLIYGVSDLPQTTKFETLFLGEENFLKGVTSVVSRFGELINKKHHFVVQEAFKDLRAKEKNESERLLYVALTRAKKSLTLMGEAHIKKDSWLDLGKDFLEKHPELIHHIKSEDEYVDPIKMSDLNVSDNINEKKINLSHFKPEFNSQSIWLYDLNTNDPEFKQSELSSFKRAELHSQFYGEVYHQAFQKFAQGVPIKSVLKNFKSMSLSIDEDALIRALEFSLNLDSPPLKELMINGHKEWGYSVLDEKNIVRKGRIDLWGEVQNTIWIVDYKMGKTQNSSKYFEQLKKYKDVLIKYLGNKKEIKLALIYPFLEKLDIV